MPAAYEADRRPEAHLEPLAVGQALPRMPLFLTTDLSVWTPLEETDAAAYSGLPTVIKDVLERRAPPETEPIAAEPERV
ncbi:MAG: hypothetical protein GXP27_15605 [Planctomycetes bacterium]|nr:hypothetical protein [Planctomycetota bacterium]